jgi:uncharacterized delta-60 repeat protein
MVVRRRLAAVLLCLAASSAAGQTVAVQWGIFLNGDAKSQVEDRFGSGIGVTGKRAMRVLTDGSVLVCGDTFNPKTKDFDFLIVRVNPDGTLEWSVRIDGAGSRDDHAYMLDTDAAEANVYVCGSTQTAAKQFAFTLLKLAVADGALLWTRTYDNGLPQKDHFGFCLSVNPATGDIVVAGPSHNGTDFDFAAVLYQSDGTFVRDFRFDGGFDDFIYVIARDSADNVIVAGPSAAAKDTAPGGPNWNYRTVKLSADLTTAAWNLTFAGAAGKEDSANDVTVDPATDAVYLTGRSFNGKHFDIVTIKYNADGSAGWAAPVVFNGPANRNDESYAVRFAAGMVLVAGTSQGDGGGYDFLVIAHDPADGDVLWTFRRNGPDNGHDFAYAVAVDAGGDVYAVGHSDGASASDITLVRLDGSDGSLVWAREFDNGGRDFGLALTVLSPDNVIVAGFGENNLNDMLVVRYGPVTPAADAYSVDEDDVLEITDPTLGVLANDGTPLGTALIVELVVAPTHGSLRLNPNGTFTYTPVADYNGPDAFTYRVFDFMGLDLGTAVATITVDPVNDAPFGFVPGKPQAVKPALVFTFLAAPVNGIFFDDMDAGTNDVEITLSVDFGTLTLGSIPAGLSFSTGDGTADATMVFQGTLAEVNAAVEGLIYTYDPAFKGIAELTVMIDDLGNTGSGGNLTAMTVIFIITSGQACRDLSTGVLAGIAMPQKSRDGLNKLLNSAAGRYDSNKIAKGDAKLVSFQDKVAADPNIAPADKTTLIAAAQAILDATP